VDAEGRVMSKYDDQYYIVDEVYDDKTLYLKALKKTANRDFEYKKMELGKEPLFFENAYKEEDIISGSKKPIKLSHMNGNFLLISNDIREKLKNIQSVGVQLYPAVIIDDDEKFHDYFWLFNVFSKQNYVDFDKSEIKRYDPKGDSHKVKKYCLSDEALDKVSEENRLIFKPTNTDVGFMFVHQKIVDVFNELKVDNIKFYKVSEWEKGMQFQEE
jgi:hypothetical protein